MNAPRPSPRVPGCLAALSVLLLWTGCVRGAADDDAAELPDLPGDDDAADDDSTPGDDDDTTEAAGPACGTPAEGSARVLCADRTDGDFAAGALAGLRIVASGIELDPATAATGSDSTGFFNGGDFLYGTWTSDVITPPVPAVEVIPSWNASTPPGTWLQVELLARVDEDWSEPYVLGVWASDPATVARTSVDGQSDAFGTVWVDTLHLWEPADALQYRLSLFSEEAGLGPRVEAAALAVADPDAPALPMAGGAAWGTILPVPERSQMVFSEGEAWCSPTSTSMVLAYWAEITGDSALSVSVPDAAAGTWDEAYGGNGNWPFNVAYGAELGMEGVVSRFDSLAQVESWIAAGVPVVISVAYGPGELDGSPISATDGHLQVVVGFDASGNPVNNDPAAPSDASVQRSYDRGQLETLWLEASGGVAYLIYPSGWPLPDNDWGLW